MCWNSIRGRLICQCVGGGVFCELYQKSKASIGEQEKFGPLVPFGPLIDPIVHLSRVTLLSKLSLVFLRASQSKFSLCEGNPQCGSNC